MRDATEFERLADAMLYQPLPRPRIPDRSGVLPSFPLDDDETFDAPASARAPEMRLTPVTPLLVLSDEDEQAPAIPAPPISSTRVARAEPSGPVIIPAFMVLRGGVTRCGLGGTIAFVGMLAVAFVTMVLFALAIVAPGSDWGLIRG